MQKLCTFHKQERAVLFNDSSQLFQPCTAWNHTDCSLLHEAYQQHTSIILKHDGPHCQQTSQPWMSLTHNASTPCLHVSTPVYGNNTSSPVTMHLGNSWPLIYCCWNERAQAFLSTLWSSDYGNNSPVQTPCGIPIPKWSWQLFHVTHSSPVAVQSVILLSEDWIFHTFMSDVFTVVRLPFPSQLSALICSVSEYAHHYATLGQVIIVPINSDQLTMNFYWSYIP